jgi:hypothetical protein
MTDDQIAVPPLESATFSIDCLPESHFAGFNKGESWNGFACPYFTFDQAQEIVAAWQARGWEARYKPRSDSFVFAVNQDLQTGESDDYEEFSGLVVDGEKLYPVGAGSWIWDETEF